MTSNRTFLFNELSKHNHMGDCWILVHGKVYDVTPLMGEHPGGDQVLLEATGIDATNEYDQIGHSEEAKQMMEKYCIGELAAQETASPALRPNVDKVAHTNNVYANNNSHVITSQLPAKLLVPLLILALGVGFAITRSFMFVKEN